MEAIINRLRAAGKTEDEAEARKKAEDEAARQKDFQRGREAGVRWASEEATPRQLRRLAGWFNRAENSASYGFDLRWEVAHWANVNSASASFARGFGEGALAVWNLVAAQV